MTKHLIRVTCVSRGWIDSSSVGSVVGGSLIDALLLIRLKLLVRHSLTPSLHSFLMGPPAATNNDYNLPNRIEMDVARRRELIMESEIKVNGVKGLNLTDSSFPSFFRVGSQPPAKPPSVCIR